ncbi:MAG TPA: hypothetical protein ENI82_04645 [Bacteroidetes bacterium]|nr:hypothetical protein [Bacteroidota bacterium]
MKKNLIVLGLLMLMVSSCLKNKSLTCEGKDKETIDESSLTFQEGFKYRMLNTNIKAVFETENSILLVKTETEENELVKYSILKQSNIWNAATWYREKVCPGYSNYHYENIILFRQGNHDFAINLEDGSLLYDEERDGLPDVKLVGFGYNYFSRWTVIDSVSQNTKEVIYKGDIREAKMPEFLISPPYDSIGRNGKLGRIMGMHAFENEFGELLLAIRFHDYEPSGQLKDLFAVYNVNQGNWVTEPVLFELDEIGHQSVVANGLIYYGSQDNVSCIDTKTGALKWGVQNAPHSPYILLAFADNSIFLQGPNGMLQRRTAETGKLIWETDLGNLQRFIVIKDKLFSIGQNFKVTDIETGTIIHTFTSPYIDCNPISYFGYTKSLMGYYDANSNLTHIFLNIDKNMVCYEIEN